MAENALNSLEYWLKNLPLDRLKPFYSVILVKFNDYLQMNNSKVNSDELISVQEKILLKPTSSTSNKGRGGRHRIPFKMFEKNADSTNNNNIELYEKIQFRILKILGQLAGEMSHCMYDANSDAVQLLAWDTVNHLRFYVPFIDIKPVIYFDRFLPRIIYLALSSANRQTKINACELLHAIVIYMIGKTAVESNVAIVELRMTKIYHNIYPALFKLACDVDSFARNLFQPLVMQMIHW